MKEAKWWQSIKEDKVECQLCPRNCTISEGKLGFCMTRQNVEGSLYSLVYGKPCAVNIDPIEKKPLYHFYPDTQILSIGTTGCNLACKFCQNWTISRAKVDDVRTYDLSPEKAVQTAKSNNCPSIAYTYNEPTVWAEYAMDIAKLAKQEGIKSVMVTNGYIQKSALHELYQWIDAANVDLKSINHEFYRKEIQGELEPVFATLKELKAMGVWIEVTNLVIPTVNDSTDELKELCEWVISNLGNETPIHFSAFHPNYKMTDKPRTSVEKLEQTRDIARDMGVKYVYVGNVYSDALNSYCPNCGKLLIKRSWMGTTKNYLEDSSCPKCDTKIDGRFSE